MIAIALSTRQHRLIHILLDQQSDVTVAYMADALQTSSRTVHRELQAVEHYLSGFGIKLRKKSGSGIRIDATTKQLDGLLLQFNHKRPTELNAAERKVLMVCMLLQQHQPIKLFTLAHELNVTMPTVSYDLDDMESWISAHQLKLIRRRGYGVELSGPERHKRKLIASLAAKHLDDSHLISFTGTMDKTQPAVHQLLTMVGKQTFRQLEEILWSMHKYLPHSLKESTYTSLLLQISIAMTRFQAGYSLPEQSDFSGDAEHPLASETVRGIAGKLSLQLPAAEAAYLQHLITQALKDDQELYADAEQPDLTDVAVRLSRCVEQHMQEPLSEDASLTEGLVKHMNLAIKRMQSGASIRNPMLLQIKKDYAKLFAIIGERVKTLLPHIELPEEEVGYITMHYGAALERLKQLPQQLKAVIVCTSGIGSSKLLATRLAKEFPGIDQVGHFNWYEAARLPEQAYDFIISTVDLPLPPSQYVRLSPLVSDDEIMKLKQFVKAHVQRSAVAAPAARAAGAVSTSAQWFQTLRHISQSVLEIVDPFEIVDYEAEQSVRTLHELLPQLLQALPSRSRIRDVPLVAEKLLQREGQGSIVLPDTRLAMLHARHETITAPVLALFRLSREIALRSEEGTAVRYMFLMLAPEQLSGYSREILSEISAMLLQPEFMRLLPAADRTQLKLFVSSQLEKHFKQKLNWRD